MFEGQAKEGYGTSVLPVNLLRTRPGREEKAKLRSRKDRFELWSVLGPNQLLANFRKNEFLLRRLGTLTVLLVKIGMAVRRAGQLPFDEQIFHLGLQFEWIATGYNHVRKLPGFERAELITQPEHLGGIKHHGFQGFIMRQAIGDRSSGVLRQAA